MGFNETEYKAYINTLQSVLKMIRSDPVACLEIEPDRVQLTISGEYVWEVHDIQEIARVLDRTMERFYDSNDDKPVEPVLDKSAGSSFSKD